MDRRLLIVDGSNLLFQMFYGMPSRIVNEQGMPIQGTLDGGSPLPFPLEELEYEPADMTTNHVLKGIGLRGSGRGS